MFLVNSAYCIPNHSAEIDKYGNVNTCMALKIFL